MGVMSLLKKSEDTLHGDGWAAAKSPAERVFLCHQLMTTDFDFFAATVARYGLYQVFRVSWQSAAGRYIFKRMNSFEAGGRCWQSDVRKKHGGRR